MQYHEVIDPRDDYIWSLIAASYLLPPLIENNLGWYLKNTVRDLWLKGLADKELEEREANIYRQFLKITSDGHGYIIGNKKEMLQTIWNIGKKYSVLPDDSEMEKIFCNEGVMIGTILHSPYAKSVIREEYVQLMDYLFDSKKLNLRNNIAHGNSTTYDYLDITFAAILLQIVQDIADGDVFV